MTDLNSIVAWVESKGNPYSIRFEPEVYKNLMTGALTQAHHDLVARIIAAHSGCSFGTACMIYCTSFGKYQMMGFNIYGAPFNYKASVYNYMTDQGAQDSSFGLYIEDRGINFAVGELAASSDLRNEFATKYNGGGANPAYVEMLIEAMQHFGMRVS